MADTNKVRYGFSHVYYSLITETEGTLTYATPKEWKGAKSISLDPEGDTSTFYADDTAYYTTSTNNGYSGSLEMAYLTDDVLKDIFGYVETANGTLAEDASVTPKDVALLFEFKGDVNAVRHIMYHVIFSRAGMEGNTKEDSVEPDTQSIDITVVPVDDGDHKWIKERVTKGDTNYDTFYTTAPTLPTEKASA